MAAVVIVGAQWGDEGKGKIVDLYAERADVVVRYAGGPNAGHTLVLGDDKLIVRLLPSGIRHPDVECVLGQGMVIDPGVLLGELDSLTSKGISFDGRVRMSERVHLILPHHRLIDELRESPASGEQKIGTTKKGIGPCYEDKAARRGLRLRDLRDKDRASALVKNALDAWTPVILALGGDVPDASKVVSELLEQAPRLLALVADVSSIVDRRLREGARVLLEGAQGTLLDIDHGTYPFVTSSSAVAGGACTGVGIGPSRIKRVVGIAKAYLTRVGAGPFPTELDDATGERLRQAGGEFGSVTGRPRRTGWIDLPALRHAALVNGLDGLALTKLDVLTGLDELRVCVAYELDGSRTPNFPLDDLDRAKPVFETLRGWKKDISAARTLSSLPEAARKYVRFIEEAVDVPVLAVSVGARRDETVVIKQPFDL